jgi:hypothetical protein
MGWAARGKDAGSARTAAGEAYARDGGRSLAALPALLRRLKASF